MPIYEYRCRECAAVIEKLQKLSDPPLAACEACGAPVDKLVSQTAFAFKGTGWYVTDYAKKSAPAASKDGDSEKAAAARGEKDKGVTPEKSDGKAEPADGGAKKPEPASSPAPSPAAAPAAAPAASSTPNG